jgi:hypothetical protein
LERIAAESLKGGANTQKLFRVAALLAGILTLLVAVGVFVMANDGGPEDVPWVGLSP